MTDDELQAIKGMLAEIEAARERLHGVMGAPDRPRAPVLQAAHELLAEVERLRELLQMANDSTLAVHDMAGAAIERLRAREMQMREMVARLAAYATEKRYADWCVWCDEQGQSYESHAADCTVTKARALLAGEAGD